MTLLELFCSVDDFCLKLNSLFQKNPLSNGKKTRNRPTQLQPSEIMTILIHFHQSKYRNFKSFYFCELQKHLSSEFPRLPSYHRFVEYTKRYLMPLTAYLCSQMGSCHGISFVDSTAIKVCHNRRIKSNKVFKDQAARGKTSVDWFFGFKLHLVFNDEGEVVWLYIGPGNGDDRHGLRQMVNNPFRKIFGKIFGDRGYIGKALFEQLFKDHDLELITGLKKNMKSKLPMRTEDAFFLRKRCIVETIIDQLKNISQIEHTRHRSVTNFLVNIICGVIAYCLQPKKPSLLSFKESLAPA
jgi:hypothetical protein